jgi:hypothetical protein
MNSGEIKQKVLKYWQNLGYKKRQRERLVDSAFPTTFNPSAGHSSIIHLRDNDPEGFMNLNYVVEALCIRQFDTSRAPFNNRLSVFNMTVPFRSSISMKDAVLQYLGLLEELGIDTTKTIWTVWGGGELGTSEEKQYLSADAETEKVLKEKGISNIYQSSSTYNYLFPPDDKEFAGPRAEIYFPLKNGSLIEIGTIEKIDHQVVHDERKVPVLVPFSEVGYTEHFIGIASGIERLEVVVNNFNEMKETENFQNYFIFFSESFTKQELVLFERNILDMIDKFRASVYAVNDGAHELKSNDSRRTSLKRFLKLVLEELQEMGVANMVYIGELYNFLEQQDLNKDILNKETRDDFLEFTAEILERLKLKTPGNWT